MFVLRRTVASADRFRTQVEVFGFSAADSFSPRSKSARIQLRPHNLNYSPFASAEIGFYGFEWRAILPRHFNNSREIVLAE